MLYEIKTLETLIARLIIENDLCDKVITPTQIKIVEYILEHSNENIYQKDLEKLLNFRRATISKVLQTMEKNKLIERIVDSYDSRVKKIILNPDTKKVFVNHFNKILEIENMAIQNISEKELRGFINVLNKMQSNLKLVANKERD